MSSTTTAVVGIGDDDEALLESVNESTLHNLCEAHSLLSSGTKVKMLQQLRLYAKTMAEEDRASHAGRVRWVESGTEGGKARHSVVDNDD